MLRRQVEAKKADHSQNPLADIWQQVSALQTKFQTGIFGSGSLFLRSIAKTLTAEQRTGYQAAFDSRAQFRLHAHVLVAASLLEKTVPIDSAQYDSLLKLLPDYVHPLEEGNEAYEWQQAYFLAQIPEEKLRPILGAEQLEAFRRSFAPYRGLNLDALRGNANQFIEIEDAMEDVE